MKESSFHDKSKIELKMVTKWLSHFVTFFSSILLLSHTFFRHVLVQSQWRFWPNESLHLHVLRSSSSLLLHLSHRHDFRDYSRSPIGAFPTWSSCSTDASSSTLCDHVYFVLDASDCAENCSNFWPRTWRSPDRGNIRNLSARICEFSSVVIISLHLSGTVTFEFPAHKRLRCNLGMSRFFILFLGNFKTIQGLLSSGKEKDENIPRWQDIRTVDSEGCGRRSSATTRSNFETKYYRYDHQWHTPIGKYFQIGFKVHKKLKKLARISKNGLWCWSLGWSSTSRL